VVVRPEGPNRRLAAILSADVVGYSRLMAEDEAATVRTLTAYRKEIQGLVADHRGRVVDATGDNLLAEFPTALDAVECAVEIQRVLGARNAGLPEDHRMEFRIGVHLGDVTVEDDRLYGDGVNIAARLEGLAEPGGVCISAEVHGQVRHKLDLGYADLGEQAAKNIPDPVHAYGLTERAEAAVGPRRSARRAMLASAAALLAAVALAVAVYWELVAPTLPGAPITSIAVLPFEDMSPGSDQKWLGDGMAEELIEALSRIEALLVIARTSAFAQRGADIATIGEKLHVGAVVEGSVRRSGNQLRVTAQLIRVADRSHLWSASYDRELANVLAIQREIAREVAEAIRTELGVSATRSWLAASRYTTPDVRAWELVQKAVDREQTYTEQGFRDEIVLTGQALAIDPEYAQAHAQHGWAYYLLWEFGFDPRGETLAKARASVERALALEPTNGSSHLLLVALSHRDCDWEGAEARLVRALKDTPSHGSLRYAYGLHLLWTGRIEEAAPQFQRVAALEPTAAWTRFSLGFLHLVEGDYKAAIKEFEGTFGWPPQGPLIVAHTHHLNGEDERAAEVLIQAYAPSQEASAAWRADYADAGLVTVLRAILKHQLAQSGRPCTNDPVSASMMLAHAGDPDRMFACLDEGVRRKRPTLWVKVSPVFEPYRDDPRFTALLRRMNLAD
jgi:TolB-like protein/class 3 adenylate cyclase